MNTEKKEAKIDFLKEKINLHKHINEAIIDLMYKNKLREIRFNLENESFPYVVRFNNEIEEVKVKAIKCNEGILVYQSNGGEGDKWNDMDTCSNILLGANEDMYSHVYEYILNLRKTTNIEV